MSEVHARKLQSEETVGSELYVAGPETEATERQTTETHRTHHITINPPEESSEQSISIVFHTSRS